MSSLWIAILAGAAGYMASIYTWPYIRAFAIGAEAEASNLRTRANIIMSAFRSTTPSPPPPAKGT